MSTHTSRETLCTKDGIDVIDCADCGFRHVYPFPTAEDYRKTYEDEYYGVVWPQYFARYEEDREWWKLCYNERYSFFQNELGDSRKTLLDVGSGPGLFLLAGKELGWDVKGIEPSNQAFEYSKGLGLDVVNQFLTKDTKDLGTFDVVHMSEVLEHIPEPKEFINITKEHLAPNGVLCIVLPNDFNPLQDIVWKSLDYDPWWVSPTHHLNYFSVETLSQLVESCGLEVLHTTTTFPIELFLLMGDKYVGNDTLGRQVHGKRKQMELNFEKAGKTDLRLKMYEALSKLGIGREIVLYAKNNA